MNEVTTSCSFEFLGSGHLQQPRQMEGKQLRLRLDTAGPDVIGEYLLPVLWIHRLSIRVLNFGPI